MTANEARILAKEYNNNLKAKFEKEFEQYMETTVYPYIKEAASKGAITACITRSTKFSNDKVMEALNKQGFKTENTYNHSFIYIEW